MRTGLDKTWLDRSERPLIVSTFEISAFSLTAMHDYQRYRNAKELLCNSMPWAYCRTNFIWKKQNSATSSDSICCHSCKHQASTSAFTAMMVWQQASSPTGKPSWPCRRSTPPCRGMAWGSEGPRPQAGGEFPRHHLEPGHGVPQALPQARGDHQLCSRGFKPPTIHH